MLQKVLLAHVGSPIGGMVLHFLDFATVIRCMRLNRAFYSWVWTAENRPRFPISVATIPNETLLLTHTTCQYGDEFHPKRYRVSFYHGCFIASCIHDKHEDRLDEMDIMRSAFDWFQSLNEKQIEFWRTRTFAVRHPVPLSCRKQATTKIVELKSIQCDDGKDMLDKVSNLQTVNQLRSIASTDLDAENQRQDTKDVDAKAVNVWRMWMKMEDEWSGLNPDQTFQRQAARIAGRRNRYSVGSLRRDAPSLFTLREIRFYQKLLADRFALFLNELRYDDFVSHQRADAKQLYSNRSKSRVQTHVCTLVTISYIVTTIFANILIPIWYYRDLHWSETMLYGIPCFLSAHNLLIAYGAMWYVKGCQLPPSLIRMRYMHMITLQIVTAFTCGELRSNFSWITREMYRLRWVNKYSEIIFWPLLAAVLCGLPFLPLYNGTSSVSIVLQVWYGIILSICTVFILVKALVRPWEMFHHHYCLLLGWADDVTVWDCDMRIPRDWLQFAFQIACCVSYTMSLWFLYQSEIQSFVLAGSITVTLFLAGQQKFFVLWHLKIFRWHLEPLGIRIKRILCIVAVLLRCVLWGASAHGFIIWRLNKDVSSQFPWWICTNLIATILCFVN
jgi:hypothetical protein